MNRCTLGSFAVGQSFKLTEKGFSQLLNLQPQLMGRISPDNIWRITSNENRIVMFAHRNITVALSVPTDLSVTISL